MQDESAVLDPPSSVGGDEDDGLGPAADPNSEEVSGVPGGRQPGDDGYVDPDGEVPPTPPAQLPDDGIDEEELEEEGQLFLLGEKELGLKVGGRKPDSASLKVKGGKIDLNGQFDRGDRFPVVFDLQVTADKDDDSIETASGTVKGTKKTQWATICGATRLGDFLALKLEGHPELLAAVRREIGLED